MSRNHSSNPLETIRKTRENIAVVLGTIISLVLCVYFFTYGTLVDSSMTGLFWVEAISAIPMVLALVYLKQVSFFLTRLWLGRRPECRETLASMTASDL